MTGSAPSLGFDTFNGVTATICYPADDPSWNALIGKEYYSGNITWEKQGVDYADCGENLIWEYDKYTDILTISGIGDMWDFALSDIPWNDYQNSIEMVMITDGVTGLGKNAFAACTKLRSITLPASVTSIGANAFGNCEGLREIIFLGDAPDIDDRAFAGVTATVIYPEGRIGWNAEVMQNYGGILTWGRSRKGDLNADGKVSSQDAVTLLWNVLFPWQYSINADVDFTRDALITVEDAVYLLWYTLFPDVYPLK